MKKLIDRIEALAEPDNGLPLSRRRLYADFARLLHEERDRLVAELKHRERVTVGETYADGYKTGLRVAWRLVNGELEEDKG